MGFGHKIWIARATFEEHSFENSFSGASDVISPVMDGFCSMSLGSGYSFR